MSTPSGQTATRAGSTPPSIHARRLDSVGTTTRTQRTDASAQARQMRVLSNMV